MLMLANRALTEASILDCLSKYQVPRANRNNTIETSPPDPKDDIDGPATLAGKNNLNLLHMVGRFNLLG
jgi:hypothetical protein